MDLAKKVFYKFKLRESDIQSNMTGYESQKHFELSQKGFNLLVNQFKFLQVTLDQKNENLTEEEENFILQKGKEKSINMKVDYEQQKVAKLNQNFYLKFLDNFQYRDKIILYFNS